MGNKQFWTKERVDLISVLVIGLFAGLAIGMIFQQMMFTASIQDAGEAWEGVITNMNIEIDLNETQIVEATYKVFGIEELNQTAEKGNKTQ